MKKMYPLLLDPPIKDYIWGGTRLKTDFGFKTELERAAEAWVLSCHPDGRCQILNGELKGSSLSQAISLWGSEAVGSSAEKNASFPILVKLIDAKDRLSVQVHPDDAYAQKYENDNGKTEMWYIIDCDPDARLVYGFNRTMTKEEVRARIESNTLDEILNYVDVKKDDAFFIPAGTVHAIGKGILIAEIQQSSNVTYRVSDYGRLGADGKPRALHIDKALEVMKLSESQLDEKAGEYNSLSPGVSVRALASCQYFNAAAYRLDAEAELFLGAKDSFVSVTLLSGSARLEQDSLDNSIDLIPGSTVFIPAGIYSKITALTDSRLITADCSNA